MRRERTLRSAEQNRPGARARWLLRKSSGCSARCRKVRGLLRESPSDFASRSHRICRPLADPAAAVPVPDLAIKLGDLFLKAGHLPEGRREGCGFFRSLVGRRSPTPPDGAQRADQTGALADQKVPRPMQYQNRLLIRARDRNKMHVRSGNRLVNRFGVNHVIFLALYIGFDIGGRDQVELMPQYSHLTYPVVAQLPSGRRDEFAPSCRQPRLSDTAVWRGCLFPFAPGASDGYPPLFCSPQSAAFPMSPVGPRMVTQGKRFLHPKIAPAFRAFAGLGFAFAPDHH